MRNREERCVVKCAEHHLQTNKEMGKSFTEGQEQVQQKQMQGQEQQQEGQ
jgi:cell fate (sporulation/competence/biofilm development) regulator YlbF (YheA/YmcA/DUF963 family)